MDRTSFITAEFNQHNFYITKNVFFDEKETFTFSPCGLSLADGATDGSQQPS